ncbi:MAG: TIGR00730 family Rossman fold protein [Deltaproteobacteria bacterium]
MSQKTTPRNQEALARTLVKEIQETAQKLLRDGADLGEIKLINTALKEMRYAFHVFAPYRGVRKVSTFGSARTQPEWPAYGQAHAFAERLANRGFMIITGAGPGIMQACQEGSGRERSFGINIQLPFEQSANEVILEDHKLINFKYFFTRKLLFVKEADAIALFPGGFGTHDEGFEALTLLQTGKADPAPAVFLDAPGGNYWKTWRDYVKEHLLDAGLISEQDMHLFKVTDDVDEAVAEITGFFHRYHSQRYVDDQLVIRMESPLTEPVLKELNRDFAEILREGAGGIVQRGALPAEADEKEIADLPRLVLPFGRADFGKLRMLIDRINAA